MMYLLPLPRSKDLLRQNQKKIDPVQSSHIHPTPSSHILPVGSNPPRPVIFTPSGRREDDRGVGAGQLGRLSQPLVLPCRCARFSRFQNRFRLAELESQLCCSWLKFNDPSIRRQRPNSDIQRMQTYIWGGGWSRARHSGARALISIPLVSWARRGSIFWLLDPFSFHAVSLSFPFVA